MMEQWNNERTRTGISDEWNSGIMNDMAKKDRMREYLNNGKDGTGILEECNHGMTEE